MIGSWYFWLFISLFGYFPVAFLVLQVYLWTEPTIVPEEDSLIEARLFFWLWPLMIALMAIVGAFWLVFEGGPKFLKHVGMALGRWVSNHSLDPVAAFIRLRVPRPSIDQSSVSSDKTQVVVDRF